MSESLITKMTEFEVVETLFYPTTIDTSHSITFNYGPPLYVCYPKREATPYYVVDIKKLFHSGKTAIPLEPITHEELDEIYSPQDRELILDKIAHDIRDRKIRQWQDLQQWCFKSTTSLKFESIFEIYDIHNMKITEKWNNILNDVLSFRAYKDPRVVLVNKATMAMGFIMKYQPHTLIITPPDIGKTSFYEKVGERYDRITQKSLSASARWKDDVTMGPFHLQHYPVTIEQIESQQLENILGILINFLDSGHGRTRAGGTRIQYNGAAPLIITANGPPRDSPKLRKINRFREILVPYLTYNNVLAIGKRFGIIAFGDYDSIKPDKDINGKDIEYDENQHNEIIKVFRAVEEAIQPSLEKFWNDQNLKKWCANVNIYSDEDKKLIENFEYTEIRDFWKGHMEYATYHICGAAINCALIDNYPLFLAIEYALPGPSYDEIFKKVISDAEIYIKRIKEINIESIKYMLS